MTKTLKLTQAFMDHVFNGKDFLNGKKMHDKYNFFTHTPPVRSGEEGYNIPDVALDPTNVPIYDQNKNSGTFGQIIRYEGTVENPIEFYGFNFGEGIEMPTDQANKWLAVKIRVKILEEFVNLNIMEEVI